MSVKVIIPMALRQFVDGQATIELDASNVGELLDGLTQQYEQLRRHLFSEDGDLRSFVNVYVNDEDVRHLQKGDTPVAEDDVVSIIPAIAGGTGNAVTSQRTMELSHEEVQRYSRHLVMPEVALEGQLRLKSASVLLVGAGGLGAPLGLYLTAAGVGRIGLVDFDVVDKTNLQRQVTFGTSDVGRPKLEAAAERLGDLNPEIEITLHPVRLDSSNALDIITEYDIVVDGTDNFATRYLVNDACVLLGKPNVYGSIFRFDGQVTVFALDGGPCYRCLYPEPPPPGLVPNCAEGGVLGVLPGIVGSIQANETIKLILGKGETLGGRLLLFDALAMKFREMKVQKDPDCPICGEERTIHELIDYDEFCGVRGVEKEKDDVDVPEIEPLTLQSRINAGDDLFVLDVREPHEHTLCNIGGVLIPMGELPSRVAELDSSREIVVYCRTGMRSAQVVNWLTQSGFERVWNLRGGIHAWSDDIDPTIPKY